MKNDEAQRLLGNGNGSNTAAKDLPTTDSKTTTTKKGYLRRSVAFGTCAVVLLGVVVFCVDRGGDGGDTITTNIVHNTIRSGRELLHYCHEDWTISYEDQPQTCYKGDEANEDKCPGYPTDMERGMCETTGTYNDVLPYLNHQEVIPGKIYYGLDFTAWSYQGTTYTPHYNPYGGKLSCRWGHGDRDYKHNDHRPPIGQCSLVESSKLINDKCPSPERHIVRAWQQCAELCNDQQFCHTFTVHTDTTNYVYLEKHIDYNCFLHEAYECKKEKNKSAGIKDYKFQEDVREAKFDNLGVWSGICRTISGRTNDYACTNTPHPKK